MCSGARGGFEGDVLDWEEEEEEGGEGGEGGEEV